MKQRNNWEHIRPLGEGGQSEVSLVRSPKRKSERDASASRIFAALRPRTAEPGPGMLSREDVRDFAEAIANFTRSELPSELGALKVFKIRETGRPDAQAQAVGRLQSEIKVLKQGRPGLLKLLDSNEADHWIVTEYCPEGTIEKNPFKYKGKPVLALKAFRSLVTTVASLHKDSIVHRDIKPANVFFANDNNLILGDFGIVFLPNQAERVTVTDERVGPRDYMPQWGDLGMRLENVHTNFDVYMLGKLLWCMVAGRLRLPREYHLRPGFNLVELFKDDSRMRLINSILDKSVVEDPENCLPSAEQLLQLVDETLVKIQQGEPMLNERTGELQLPCRMCNKGFYRPRRETLQLSNDSEHPTLLRIFACTVCTHSVFFSPGNPGEAASRNWTPWMID